MQQMFERVVECNPNTSIINHVSIKYTKVCPHCAVAVAFHNVPQRFCIPILLSIALYTFEKVHRIIYQLLKKVN